MDGWGRYDSESSSSSDDENAAYYDFRKRNTTIIQKPSTLQRSSNKKGQVVVQSNESFSSTSSESPTYELNGQFSGSESSLDDSNSPLDLSTPKGWKHKDRAPRIDGLSKQNHKQLQKCEQLKWPNQRVIISKVNESNHHGHQLHRERIGEQSTSSFSSIKGEIGESPDIAGLDTPSSCDDNSPIYQNVMKGKRLFDIRSMAEKPSISSFPSLSSMNAFGYQGNEGLASYTSLPYASYLDESHSRYGGRSVSQLPSSSSLMSNFNETAANEREEMANMSNLSSFSYMSSISALRKPTTSIKDCKTTDSSPVSIISNFTGSVEEAREGLASYNSLTSLYKSPSESIYAEINPEPKSSSDYIRMERLGEGLASYTSLPGFRYESSSEEPSFNLNSTILAAPQSDYIDMNKVNVNAQYASVEKKGNRKSSSNQSSNSATPVNDVKTSNKILREQFFTSEDLSGDYVELSKCQAYLKAVKERESETICHSNSVQTNINSHASSISIQAPNLPTKPPLPPKLLPKDKYVPLPPKQPLVVKQLFANRENMRSISPSPLVLKKPSESTCSDVECETKDTICSVEEVNRTKENQGLDGIVIDNNKSSSSIMSFQGGGRSLLTTNNLTLGESICEGREGLASCLSLPDFDENSDMCSPNCSQNLNDISKISLNCVKSSQNTIQNITELCPLPKQFGDPKIINCALNLSSLRGSHSDSGVECASVSTPVIHSDQTSNTGDPIVDNIEEVFSLAGSSSLNSTSSVADTDSCNQWLSQNSESSHNSSNTHSGKSNLTVLQVDLSHLSDKKLNKDSSQTSIKSLNHSVASHVSETRLSASNSMSSIYSTCSNSSSVHSVSQEATNQVQTIADDSGSSSNLQSNRLNESKHSINSENENASLLALYGNGASTPRASASSSVRFPNDTLLGSPIATYTRLPARCDVGGSRVVRSPCVKPSMLNLKNKCEDGAFLNFKSMDSKCKSIQKLVNSSNVNSDTGSRKALKDKDIPIGSVTNLGAIPIQEEEEEEVQMVYANAFRRVDIGSDNVPSNVVVRSTVKRVPSMSEPKQSFYSINPHQNTQGLFQPTNSNSLGSLNSQNHISNAQVINMRTKTATVRNTRPQSALGRIQGESSTLPRTKTSRVVRLQTTSGSVLSPHRNVLPDIIPYDESEQEELLPPSEVLFKAPLPVHHSSSSRHSAENMLASVASSNYIPMTGSMSKMPNSRSLDTVSVSSLFQNGSSEDNYAMDSSNSSLDCDNFSFDFNQPEDSVTSVMFSSTVDFQQSENSEDTAIYQDIDAHGLGAYGGHDYETKPKKHHREQTRTDDNIRSPKVSRKIKKRDKENSPDRRNYPKSPLPVHHTIKDKKTEPLSPKKNSRFFPWTNKGGDTSPKSKLFSLRKKDRKESSKSKRKKDAYERFEPAPVFDHDTDWKTKLHTLCNGKRVVRYLNYSQSQSPMIIKHYPPPKESTRIKWNSNLIQDGESDDSNEYAVIHPKSILSKKSKEYKYDGDVPSPIIITKTRQLSVSGRRHSRK